MSIAAGTRIGIYEVRSLIGKGGMGEVYRARDMRLQRDVALKVLPEGFASDMQRMARFEREAKVLASLNHPNIGAIYGVEESGSTLALVMELVEGPTLAERIAAGAVPLDEALPIVRQMAEAVEYAHDNNVIHRDLKPANIKVKADGTVKVLDFGLAKAMSDDPTEGDMNNSPTLSMAATRQGVILGTAPYMSPEQAKGKAVDRRTDVWAFGVILYEMLVGKQLFGGETIADTLAHVITKEPAFDTLPASTPPAIRALLRRCLDKNVRRRLGHMSEARILLEDVLSGNAGGLQSGIAESAATTPIRRLAFPGRAAWVIAAIAAVVVLALAIPAVMHLREPAPSVPQAVRFSIAPPEGVRLNQGVYVTVVSPDGTMLAFLEDTSSGTTQLWVRPLNSEVAQPLAGTEGALSPFWLADSRSLAFYADGKLKKAAASGGPAQTLAEAPLGGQYPLSGGKGSSNQAGVVLFVPPAAGTVHRVSAAGGAAAPVTVLDAARNETGHFWPEFLPDGRHFLYLALSSNPKNNAIFVGSLDSQERKLLFNVMSSVAYVAPGYLLFCRDGTLMAQSLDMERLELRGDAFPIAEDVQYNATAGMAAFSASQTGLLAYRTNGAQNAQLTWMDRAGRKLGTVAESGPYQQIALSPDEKRLLVQRLGGDGFDLWMLDLSRSIFSRLTTDPGNEVDPIWSPDGGKIAYLAFRKGTREIYQMTLESGQEELLAESSEQNYPDDWSRDGQYLIYHSPAGGRKISVLPLSGDRKPRIVLETDFRKDEPQFSPDGRWLAYMSDESGRHEIYIQPFQGQGEKLRLSTNGGGQPRWRKDGREILYLALDGAMMSVPIHPGANTLTPGTPTSLFQSGIAVNPVIDQFAVTSDGQRFLLAVPVGAAPPISVVLNWTAELNQR